MNVTEAQKAEIQNYVSSGDFGGGYRYIVSLIDLDPDQSVSAEVRTWFDGAADVNQSIGAFSAFIRNYTADQYLSRTGTVIPTGALQDASNGIASKVLNSIINQGYIPSLHDIGVEDIDGTSTIFQGDTKAWSGNLLFGMLGDASFFDSNITPDPTETYDLLVAMKSAFVALDGVNDTLGDIGQVAFTGISLLLPPGVSSTGTVLGMVNRTNNFLHEAYGLTLPQIAGMRIMLNQQGASSTVLGTSGSEIIHASDGQDVIMGSAGGDIIDGGSGNDTASYANTTSPITFDIIEHTSAVRFTASAINSAAGISDYLYDIEKIVGSGSADVFNIEYLRHDQTSTTLDGGGGDDRFNLKILPFNGKELAIRGGSGDDTVSFDFFNAPVTFDSHQGTATISSYTIEIREVERLIGSKSDDTFILDHDDIAIQGGAGSDIVDYGSATAPVHLEEGIITTVETIRGSGGADVLVGQQGATMFGGLGDDLFLSVGSSTFFVGGEFGEGGSTSPNGVDTLSFQRLSSGITIDMHSGTASNGDTFRGMEIIVGTGHADTFEAVTNFQQFGSQKTTIRGGNGNDVMSVVNGVEAYGDNDDDTFHVDGYLGSLNSGYSPGIPISGASIPTHVVHGGTGHDRLVIGSSTGGMGVTANAGSGSGSIGTLSYDGIEELQFDASFINVNGSGGADVIRGGLVSSTVHGGGGSDVLYARGNAQDYLYGDEGADFLYGNGGDEIHGGSGNDTIYAGEGGQSYLYGDDGDDKIYGGPGNDVIYGGKGNDLIYGGDGDDYVNYTYADGSLVSVTNHGSYFEVVTGVVTGGTVDSNGWWVPTYTYETDLLYGCEYLFMNGSGWQLTPDFSYPNF